MNLVPICTDCNRYFKRDVDPIDDHRAEPLLNIFHPYGRPVRDHLEIRVSRNATGSYEVQLLDTSCLAAGGGSRRMRNLERVLRLQQLWQEDYLGKALKEITHSLRDIGASLKTRGMMRGKDDVVERLQQDLYEADRKIGILPFYLVKRAYVEYALYNEDELLTLQGEFEGTSPPFISFRASARSSHWHATPRAEAKRRRGAFREETAQTS